MLQNLAIIFITIQNQLCSTSLIRGIPTLMGAAALCPLPAPLAEHRASPRRPGTGRHCCARSSGGTATSQGEPTGPRGAAGDVWAPQLLGWCCWGFMAQPRCRAVSRDASLSPALHPCQHSSSPLASPRPPWQAMCSQTCGAAPWPGLQAARRRGAPLPGRVCAALSPLPDALHPPAPEGRSLLLLRIPRSCSFSFQ